MKKISTTIFAILLIGKISSQSFRNAFDRYESGLGGAQGQGYSFHSNVNFDLNTGESPYLKSYIIMFKATKDKKYLDKFIIHSKRVQERIDDNIKTT